jgi:hypothetical protein
MEKAPLTTARMYNTPTQLGAQYPEMLEHLLEPQFDDPTLVTPAKLLDATIKTQEWLQEFDSPTTVVAAQRATPNEKSLARAAFVGVTDPGAQPQAATQKLLALKTPNAVAHLVQMLTAYDWQFVAQAAEIRGYVVAKLLEESQGDKASDRLRAIQLLGTVSEVASFTERVEITHKHEDSEEIAERIRARLKSLLPPVQEVEDAEVKEVAVVPHAEPTLPQ